VSQRERVVRIGVVQMAMSESRAENLARAEGFVADAVAQGASLVVLPELVADRYFPQRMDPARYDLAEPVPDGPVSQAVANMARRHGVAVIGGAYERATEGRLFNTSLAVGTDGELAGRYRKVHIPHGPGYEEKFYFTPGDLGFRVFDTRVGRIGTLVCWDQWYPEGARLTALQGASILFYPTAIGWHPNEKASHGPQQLDAWRTIQRSHAIANGLYVAAVNRVGHEPADAGEDGGGIDFWGSSFLADPFGAVMTEAPADRETLLIGEVDLARIEEVRRGWPFLRDRRIDAYAGIGSRYIDHPS
jgi:N-carbamoylputrescine amidase